ncbi:MAG: hypothetical protein ABIN89_06625 [Chitinophagaceae bacterium]
MKKFLLTVMIFVSVKMAFSQALSGKVDYQKSQQPAAIIELPYNPDLLEGALKDHFSKKGVKASSSKGFIVFKNVQLSAADATWSDLYFKIDRKSRKENDISVVNLVVTKPNENPATRSSEDNAGIDQAKNFLNEISPAVDAYSLDLSIKGQDDEVKKAEKKLNNLVDDAKDLEKRKKSAEDKIQENLQDQEKQKAELEKQRQLLEVLNSKKKT